VKPSGCRRIWQIWLPLPVLSVAKTEERRRKQREHKSIGGCFFAIVSTPIVHPPPPPPRTEGSGRLGSQGYSTGIPRTVQKQKWYQKKQEKECLCAAWLINSVCFLSQHRITSLCYCFDSPTPPQPLIFSSRSSLAVRDYFHNHTKQRECRLSRGQKHFCFAIRILRTVKNTSQSSMLVFR
jgi:hypothetical protein